MRERVILFLILFGFPITFNLIASLRVEAVSKKQIDTRLTMLETNFQQKITEQQRQMNLIEAEKNNWQKRAAKTKKRLEVFQEQQQRLQEKYNEIYPVIAKLDSQIKLLTEISKFENVTTGFSTPRISIKTRLPK